MACTVVCISRALGAGGEEIGRLIAAELGFRYADEEIIVRAAKEAGVSLDTVEQAEKTPRLLQRILESMARTPPATEALSGVVPPDSLGTATFEGVIERVIHTLASEGNVIIVAHGASLPLADVSGVLRVLVTASPEIRAERLAKRTDLDASRAKKAIQESDRQRQQYLRRFYDVASELPTHYDLVINTDALAAPLATRLVVTAAKG